MPQIIVKADRGDGREEDVVMLRERINSRDFECATFASRLVERLGWAIDDAHAVEQAAAHAVEQAAEDTPQTPTAAPEHEPRRTPVTA